MLPIACGPSGSLEARRPFQLLSKRYCLAIDCEEFRVYGSYVDDVLVFANNQPKSEPRRIGMVGWRARMQVLYRIRVSRHLRGFGNHLGFPIVMTIVFWAICVGPTLTEALVSRLVQDFKSISSCSKLPNTLIFLSSAKFHIRNILAMCNIELVPSNVQNIRGHILR